MICLSQASEQSPTSLASIAKEEGISPKYLERIFAKLKKAHLIRSEKGASGGYVLTKPAKEIRVLEIVEILEGDISLFHCVNKDGEIKCSSSCSCGATAVLIRVQQAVCSTLNDIFLSDLVKK